MAEITGATENAELLTQARQLHHAGKFAEAERLYRKILSAQPQNGQAMQLLGVLMCQTSRPRPGAEMLQQAVQVDPANAEAWLNLAVVRHMAGDLEGTHQAVQESVRLRPDNPDALTKLGYVLYDLGRFQEAEAPLLKAVSLAPGFAEAHFNLGDVYRRLGRGPDAERSYREAIRLQPNHADALNNLGTTLIALSRFDEAISVLKRAGQLRQKDPEVLANLASALQMRGWTNDASVVLQRVLEIDPNNVRATLDLATVLRSQERADEASALCRRLAERDPSRVEAARTAATMMEYAALGEEAREFLKPWAGNDSIDAVRAIMLPLIPDSQDHMDSERERFGRDLDLLTERKLQFVDPMVEVGLPGFFLAYHRDPELHLQRKLARFYEQSNRELTMVAPHVDRTPRGERIKLGVVSGMMHRHTIGKLYAGVVERLNPERFEVIVFDAGRVDDDVAKRVESKVSKRVLLHPVLPAARAQIAAEECDALFYPEIGMSNLCYFLAFSRLARKQFLTWGHPSSPGISNLDAFISSELLETPEADAYYAEQLIRLPDLGIYFHRPSLPQQVPSRSELGLPEGKRVYLCPQTLFKLHPDFDDAVAEILRRDPDGVYVVLKGKIAAWSEKYRARFERRQPDVADRMLMIPPVPLDRYLSLCYHADAILDPFYFGGGNSSLEMFAVGSPMVTLPGWHMRARITLALYKKMGMMDLVVDSPEAFIAKSIEFAQDRDFREAMRQKTLERCPVLYEDEGPVRQFEEAIERLMD